MAINASNTTPAVRAPDQTDVTDAIKALEEAKKQRDALLASWIQDLKKLAEMVKEGHTEAAYQMVQQQLLPNITEAKGGDLGVTSSVMDVSSALTVLASQTQGLLNGGAKITPEQAADFVANVKRIYNLVDAEMKRPGNPDDKWVDNRTGQAILDALTSYAKALGGGNANSPNDPAFNAADVQKNWTWANNNPTNPLSQAAFQQVQAGSSKWTNTLTAFSTTLSAQVQFTFQDIGQYRAIAQSGLQGTEDQNLAIIRNSGK